MSEAGAKVFSFVSRHPASVKARRLTAQLARRVEPIETLENETFDVIIGRPEAIAAHGAVLDGVDQVAITSPLDEGTSFDDSLVHDMALYARSGLGYLTREIDRNWTLSRPALPLNRQAGILAGVAAGLAAVALDIEAGAGSRNARRVEIDQLELLALMPMQPVAFAEFLGRIVGQDVAGRGVGGTVESADGLAYVGAVEPTHWARLLELVGDPGELAERVENDPGVVREHRELVDEAIRSWSRERTTDEISDEGQAEHLPVAPVYPPARVVVDRHLNERAFFRADRSGIEVPWLTELGEPTGGSAPRFENKVRPQPRGKHNLPLAGLRVLDLSWAWAGPFATTMLADLGAEVVNVEWHPRASNLRRNPPFANDRSESHNTAGWWSANHRGKLSIGVNMKAERGRQVVHDLAAVSDVVVENFSPGVVDRLGVGFDDLVKVNPRIVYVSLSAFGQSGPRSHYVGYGTQLYTASGAGHATSQDGETISQMFIPFPDPVSGLVGAFTIAAHVRHARRTGTPARVDVSELEAIAAVALEPLLDVLDGDAEVNERRYLVVESKNGEVFALIARDEADWPAFAVALGASDASDTALREQAASMDRAAALARVERAGLFATTLAHSGEVLADSYLDERGFWRPDTSVEVASTRARIGGSLFTVDGLRTEIWRGAPSLFGDSRAVLRDLLDYPAAAIDSLVEEGSIAASD